MARSKKLIKIYILYVNILPLLEFITVIQMKKYISFLVLASLNSSIAIADWIPITKTAAYIEYSDSTTKRRFGENVRIWEMKNYNLPQPTSSGRVYRSNKIESEYDCINQRTRFITLIFYSLEYGYGEVVSMYESEFPWSSVAPGSTSSKLIQFACGKN